MRGQGHWLMWLQSRRGRSYAGENQAYREAPFPSIFICKLDAHSDEPPPNPMIYFEPAPREKPKGLF